MTDFLVRRFVRDSENTESTEVRTRYGILASVVGIFCNVFLFAAKLIIGTLMHSLAVTADAFNNLSDAASSIISFIGVKMAGDAASDSEIVLSVFMYCCADHNIEIAVTVERQITDRAGIKIASAVLQFFNDLHRTQFR